MKKLLAIVLMTFLICGICCSCGTENSTQGKSKSADDELQGSWIMEAGEMTTEYKFDNGKFTSNTSAKGISLGEKTGTYTIAKDKIELNYSDGVKADLDYSFENEKLVIYGVENETLKKK